MNIYLILTKNLENTEAPTLRQHEVNAIFQKWISHKLVKDGNNFYDPVDIMISNYFTKLLINLIFNSISLTIFSVFAKWGKPARS